MPTFPPAVPIWLALAPADLRKGFDALAELVRQHLRDDPFGAPGQGGGPAAARGLATTSSAQSACRPRGPHPWFQAVSDADGHPATPGGGGGMDGKEWQGPRMRQVAHSARGFSASSSRSNPIAQPIPSGHRPPPATCFCAPNWSHSTSNPSST